MPNYRYQTQDCQSRQGRSCPNQGMCRGAQQSGRQLSDLPVAMAYVPWQEWYGIFDLEKGFCKAQRGFEEHRDLREHGVREDMRYVY